MSFRSNTSNTVFALKRARYEEQEQTKIGAPVLVLSVLITSYFYCVPLARLESAGTDWRIYDIVFALFFLFFGLHFLPRLQQLFKDRNTFLYWAGLLLVMVWLSLILTVGIGGMSRLPPAIIRSIRFSAYFFTAGFVVLLADTPRRYRFLFGVIYINIATQAVLAFAQGMGRLGSFWPVYYTAIYGVLPVGTLSPHHKQIGVVMLLGISMSLTLLRSKSGALRVVVLGLLAIMVMVPIFAKSRTAWLGFAFLFAGYVFINRQQSIRILLAVGVGLMVIFTVGSNSLVSVLQDNVNEVFIDRYERLGFEGIAGDRLLVYDNYPDAIAKSPWVLLTGVGFQNVLKFISAAGAHNNYAQAWFELGIFGFVFYMRMLFSVLKSLRSTADVTESCFERAAAQDAWAAFIAVMATMLVGETLWAQSSMYTLTGQIMTYMALAAAPLHYPSFAKKEQK
ncbi:MAG: O-antigen ligase family protein [Anaerolineales bacterium]|nr:O-antigen ligase family protein [Anaerolineales bacterium]